MVRKRDPFWQYTKQLDGKCKCNFCHKKISGGAQRVKWHLSGIKGGGIEKCTKVPDDVRVGATEAISETNKRIKIEACSGKTEETLPDMLISEQAVMLDKLLAKFVVLNDIDVDIVMSPSFINLLKGVAEHGSHYKIPCCSIVKTKLVPDFEKEIGEYVSNVKKSWDTTGCTIIFDIWRDKERCFVNIFAHSIEGKVLFDVLDIRKHVSKSFLQEYLCYVIEKTGPNNIVQYIIKDAGEKGLYEDMLIGNYPHVYQTKCIAHEIHLLFEDIYNGVEWVQKIFDQAREVVTKINKHDGILSSMKQSTKSWGYLNYYMLQLVMGAESELRSPSSGFEKDESGLEVGGIICNSEFWIEGKEILHALKSIFLVLRLVDGYSATSGYLYAAVKIADESIKKKSETNALKYMKLWDVFKQWQEKVIDPIHAAAAFLNPAYMCSEKFIPDSAMKRGIGVIHDKLVDGEEKEKFTREMNNYRNKVPELFTSTARTMLRTSHPCDWWEYCGDVVPVLRKYAIRILSQPCSTSSRNRGLSAFETAQIEKRKPLVPAVMENYLNFRTQALLMETFDAVKEKIGNPLDLEKLDELPDCKEFINGNFTSGLLDETKVPLSDGKLKCWSASARTDNESEKHLLLHFISKLPSSLDKGNEVKGERGDPIHVILVDSNTGSIVRSGPSSVLELAVTVIRGDFHEEAGKNWTREFFERNEIMEREGKMPLLNGVLSVVLDKGMGTLGAFTLNDESSWTENRTCRLGVKTALGYCEGIRILEGTSNAFTVEDVKRADPPVDADGTLSSTSSTKELLGRVRGTSPAEPLALSLGPQCQARDESAEDPSRSLFADAQGAAACSSVNDGWDSAMDLSSGLNDSRFWWETQEATGKFVLPDGTDLEMYLGLSDQSSYGCQKGL